MPVYRRADLSRNMTLVVALFPTAVELEAFVRKFRTGPSVWNRSNFPMVQGGVT